MKIRHVLLRSSMLGQGLSMLGLALLGLSLFVTPILAQVRHDGSDRSEQAEQSSAALMSAIPRMAEEDDRIVYPVFDQPGDGALWVRGSLLASIQLHRTGHT